VIAVHHLFDHFSDVGRLVEVGLGSGPVGDQVEVELFAVFVLLVGFEVDVVGGGVDVHGAAGVGQGAGVRVQGVAV